MPNIKAARVGTLIDIQVGKNLRAYRLRSKLTLSELADQIGLSYQQVQKYETGGNRISAGTLAQISDVLMVPIAKFFPQEPEAAINRASIKPEILHLQMEAMALVESEDDLRVLNSVVTLLKAIHK